LSVCLFVCCLHDISQTDAARITKRQTNFHDELWNQKNQRSRSRGTKKQVSIRLLLESNIAARCVRKPRWVFLAAMPHRASQASVTGFSLRHFPDVDAAADITAGFFSAWSFFRSQPAAITLPSWVMALVVIITT